MRRLLTFESLAIAALIVVASLIRYHMNQVCIWDAHFYHLYSAAGKLIHFKSVPLYFQEIGPLYIPYGPCLVYLYAPFLLIFRGLRSLIWFSIFLEGLSIYFFYRIGRDFYSRAAGMIAALLYACSYFVISSAGDFSNGYFSSLFFLLFVYSILQVEIAERPRYLVALFLSSAILLQIHLSAYVIIPLLTIFMVKKTRNGAPYKRAGLFLFLLAFAPLLLHFILHGSELFEEISGSIMLLSSGGGQSELTSGGPIRKIWDSYQQAILFCNFIYDKTIRPVRLFSADIELSRGEWFLLGLNIICTLSVIISAARNLVRNIRGRRTLLGDREILWASFLPCILLLFLASPYFQDYHFTLLNIVTIGMISVTLGRMWGLGAPGRAKVYSMLRRGAVLFLVLLVCALNGRAAVKKGQRWDRERMFSFGAQEKIAETIIQMSPGRMTGGSGEGGKAGVARIFSIASNIFYGKDRQLHFNWPETCLGAILETYLQGDPGRRIFSARSEFLLIFDRPEEARGILHAGKREREGFTILRCRSRIDPERSRVSYGFEEGWTGSGFDDDHWKMKSLPFRIPESDTLFHPHLEDLDEVVDREELDFITPGADGTIGPDSKWIDRLLIPEVYARLRLIHDRPAECAALYILSLQQPGSGPAEGTLESLELWINGRAVERSSMSVLDPGTIRIDRMEARLEPGENLIALRLEDYQLFDALVALDLYWDTECPP